MFKTHSTVDSTVNPWLSEPLIFSGNDMDVRFYILFDYMCNPFPPISLDNRVHCITNNPTFFLI